MYFSVNCKTEETRDTAEADDELEKIYTRIRELECSIVTLGEILDWVSAPVLNCVLLR